jgi:hypothetical protein
MALLLFRGTFGQVWKVYPARGRRFQAQAGDRHRGIALGFDLSKEKAKEVSYVKKRPRLRAVNLAVVHELLYTKYVDWQYEQEVRMFTSLNDIDPETQLYFADFGDDCALREVIVGPLSSVTEHDLHGALGKSNLEGVSFTQARLAFNSFRVVTDQRGLRRIARWFQCFGFCGPNIRVIETQRWPVRR